MPYFDSPKVELARLDPARLVEACIEGGAGGRMRLLPILLYLLFSAACAYGRPAVEVNRFPPSDAEEAVWASVLTTFVSDSTKQLIIVDSARVLPAHIIYTQSLSERFPGIDAEFIRRYVEANASGRAMPEFADFGVPVGRVGDADLAPISDAASNPDEYWNAFYATYPDSPGLIRLFRVGFDPSLEQALVFVSHACGGRCGSGSYTLLSRVDSAWVVVGRSGVFVI